jgi:WD40 repeat protein
MFSQSGKRLLTVGSDLVARVWDVGLGKQIYAGKGALDAWLSPDGQTVAISGQGTRLHTVDQPAGDGFTPIKGAAAATCVNGQGELVVSTGEDLRFFQPGSVKEVRRAASGPNAHRSTFTKDGLFRFDFDDRGGADFVKVATGTRTCHLKSCGSRPLPTAFEEDQKIYALDSSRKNLSCYSFDSQIQWTYALESPANGDLVVSPSGGYVAVSCESCKTILISTSSGQEISSFAGPVAAIHSIAFSDDNSRLAVASADHQAYLFRLLVRSATIVCYGHSGEVRSVQFSPDGTRLLTASQDGTARLWDVATGDELLSLGHHGPDLHSAIFNLDGTQIFTSTQAPDGGIRMYTFPVGKMANVIG